MLSAMGLSLMVARLQCHIQMVGNHAVSQRLELTGHSSQCHLLRLERPHLHSLADQTWAFQVILQTPSLLQHGSVTTQMRLR